MTLLRYLFIIITVLYLVKLVFRLLLPFLFQSLVKKAANQQPPPRGQQQQRRPPEGSVHIDYVPPKDKEARASDRAGDFIDYEDVK